METINNTDPHDELSEAELVGEALSAVFNYIEQAVQLSAQLKLVLDTLHPSLVDLNELGKNASIRERLHSLLKHVKVDRGSSEVQCEIGNIVFLDEPETSSLYKKTFKVKDTYAQDGELYCYIESYNTVTRSLDLDPITSRPLQDLRVKDSMCVILKQD